MSTGVATVSQRQPQEGHLSLVPPPEDQRAHLDAGSAQTDETRTAKEALSDAELVEAAREGAAWAAEALFRRHVAWVDALAYRLAIREADADDIVQESFAEALANLDRLREPAAFRGWLRTIVLHSARRLFRRIRLRRKLGMENRFPVDTSHLVSPSAPPDIAAELRRLYSRIQEMPADIRLVLVLRRVERWTISEIAKELQVSEGTVKRRIKKGDRLIEKLSRQRGES